MRVKRILGVGAFLAASVLPFTGVASAKFAQCSYGALPSDHRRSFSVCYDNTGAPTGTQYAMQYCNGAWQYGNVVHYVQYQSTTPICYGTITYRSMANGD